MLNKQMISYQTLKDLAEERLKETRILFNKRRYPGAAYLSGYVIELALKAKICKQLEIEEYPAHEKDEHKGVFAVHNLPRLLYFSGLSSKMNVSNPINNEWSFFIDKENGWRPDFRYTMQYNNKKAKTEELIGSVEKIFSWIKTIW